MQPGDLVVRDAMCADGLVGSCILLMQRHGSRGSWSHIALWVLGLTELGGSSMHPQTGGRYIHHCQ